MENLSLENLNELLKRVGMEGEDSKEYAEAKLETFINEKQEEVVPALKKLEAAIGQVEMYADLRRCWNRTVLAFNLSNKPKYTMLKMVADLGAGNAADEAAETGVLSPDKVKRVKQVTAAAFFFRLEHLNDFEDANTLFTAMPGLCLIIDDMVDQQIENLGYTGDPLTMFLVSSVSDDEPEFL